ncbi:hypothetical protein NMY22_g17482 [Coprinellus aureogranulatus]|nr:hypothetical protein NMY22_g17482 [Coprinellus aureogranulatus]
MHQYWLRSCSSLVNFAFLVLPLRCRYSFCLRQQSRHPDRGANWERGQHQPSGQSHNYTYNSGFFSPSGLSFIPTLAPLGPITRLADDLVPNLVLDLSHDEQLLSPGRSSLNLFLVLLPSLVVYFLAFASHQPPYSLPPGLIDHSHQSWTSLRSDRS